MYIFKRLVRHRPAIPNLYCNLKRLPDFEYLSSQIQLGGDGANTSHTATVGRRNTRGRAVNNQSGACIFNFCPHPEVSPRVATEDT